MVRAWASDVRQIAGIIGGATTGVAKGVRMVSVRVLNSRGSGLWSDVVAGIEFVIAHVASTARKVLHLSAVGPSSAIVQAAVERAVALGIPVIVPSGNGNTAVTIRAPGGSRDRIAVRRRRSRGAHACVGLCATTAVAVTPTYFNDSIPYWCNRGRDVHLYAPGKSCDSCFTTRRPSWTWALSFHLSPRIQSVCVGLVDFRCVCLMWYVLHRHQHQLHVADWWLHCCVGVSCGCDVHHGALRLRCTRSACHWHGRGCLGRT
jgi:hypothetical protein